jgi:hypothetical protein
MPAPFAAASRLSHLLSAPVRTRVDRARRGEDPCETCPPGSATRATAHQCHDHEWLGGLVAVAPFAPGVAAATTTLAYVLRLGQSPVVIGSWQDDLLAIALGFVAGVVFWLGMGWRCRHLASAEHGHSPSYDQLTARFRQLETRRKVFCEPQPIGWDRLRGDECQRACAACREAEELCQAVAEDLKCAGPQWVTATAYDAQWRRLHRAEEALLEVVPHDTLITEALYDYQRLQGSGLGDSERLAARMEWVLKRLHLDDCMCFSNPNGGDSRSPSGGGGIQGTEARRVRSLLHLFRGTRESRVRAILREVRFGINDYRERQTAGLIRARNRLLNATFATSVAGCTLLALVVVAGTPPATIAAIAGCYLVGAAVGLFNRMRLESQVEDAIDDYGLSTARLIHTPLFSGLAAVAGVFLTFSLAAAVTDAVVEMPMAIEAPTSSGTAGQAGGAPAIGGRPDTQPEVLNPNDRLRRVDEVFDLADNPFALVVAAVFGLTPDLVISRIKDATDRLAVNLAKTQPLTETSESEAA